MKKFLILCFCVFSFNAYSQSCNPDCIWTFTNNTDIDDPNGGCCVDLYFDYDCNPRQGPFNVCTTKPGGADLCVQFDNCPSECPKAAVFPVGPPINTDPTTLPNRYEFPGEPMPCSDGTSTVCPNGWYVNVTSSGLEFGCL